MSDAGPNTDANPSQGAFLASVPLFNDEYYYMHSARLQGYYVSLAWAPFALEQYWLSS